VPPRRTARARFSPSKGVNILNAVVELLEDNKITDEHLQYINVDSVVTSLTEKVPDRTLYVSQPKVLVHKHTTLGRRSVTYIDIYVVALFYYHSESYQ